MGERDFVIDNRQFLFIDFDHDHPSWQGSKLGAMKKKVRAVSESNTFTVVTCSFPGSAHGCIGERQDVYAIPNIVRPFPIMRSSRNYWNQYELPPSSNNPASLTTRFGATIDVEQNHVRFLGDLVLNLWDCGGQDSFMDSYLSTQRSTIFQHVAVLIYVFDIETREAVKDLEYYRDCIDGLKKYSSEAKVFLLVHKMDLVRESPDDALAKKRTQLEQESTDLTVTVFGTSIYNESLYRVRCFIIPLKTPGPKLLCTRPGLVSFTP